MLFPVHHLVSVCPLTGVIARLDRGRVHILGTRRDSHKIRDLNVERSEN